jgi:uncharacterized protein (UPF0371 family)
MNTTDIPIFLNTGFDNTYYVKLQKEEILKRINVLSSGHLYLEIGGKFLYDAHAARVLPGFNPRVKVEIIKSLGIPFEIVFCMNYADILSNRQLNNRQEDYVTTSLKMITDLQDTFGVSVKICINNIKVEPGENGEKFLKALEDIKDVNSDIHFRYYIPGYPNDVKKILSPNGFGKDEDINIKEKLVLVTGSASNSGKLSTCLGMVYKDSTKELISNYAKYETFPVWNLPLEHPLNLAYEAATADIGDKNVIDTYYKQAYRKTAVNYNRDMQAFSIIKKLMKTEYSSPTEMCVSNVGQAIKNDEIVSVASLLEIRRRKDWYKEINDKETAWVKECEELESDAMKYIKGHGYNPDLALIQS